MMLRRNMSITQTVDGIGMSCHFLMAIVCHDFIERNAPKNFRWYSESILPLPWTQADWQSELKFLDISAYTDTQGILLKQTHSHGVLTRQDSWEGT